MVQPAPQPFSVAATASVSGWSGSGVNPASESSGVVSSYPGPHYVEEQSLNIAYTRVPFGSPSSNTLKLNDGSAAYQINRTQLACIITANYSRKKVDAVFSTPNYQQPQKFQFLGVSSDAQGNSYGAIDASTLGPAGEIVTSQPWYLRRPWNEATDTETTSSVTVANYAIGTSGCNGLVASLDQQTYQEFKYFFRNSLNELSFVADDSPFAFGGILPNGYSLYGPYNTNQESLVKIINFIDDIGNRLSAIELHPIPGTIIDNSYFALNGGLPLYSAFRHDYS